MRAMRRPEAWPTDSPPPGLKPTARLSGVSSQASSSSALMLTAAAKSAAIPARSRLIVLHHDAALDDHVDILELADVGQRVAVDGDQVAVAADRDRADVALAPQRLRGASGRGLDRLDRGHPPFDHLGELAAIVAVRIDAGVGPEQHRHAGAHRPLEGLALLQADRLLLVEAFLLGAVRSAGGED